MSSASRPQQIGKLIATHLHSIFVKLNLSTAGGSMVSIDRVEMSRDLSVAQVYLCVYPSTQAALALAQIKKDEWVIKKELVAQIKNQLRKMPTLVFYSDDYLDRKDRMDHLLRKIAE